MPIYSKKQLRRLLGQRYMYDMPNGPQLNQGAPSSPLQVYQATSTVWTNFGASGQNLYQGAWLYVEGSVNSLPDAAISMSQYTIGTYNCGSGVFITNETVQGGTGFHWANAVFEVHTRISPTDKEYAIDDTVKRLRLRREVAIATVDGLAFYPLGAAGSPNVIDRVLDVHVFTNPTGSLTRDIRHVDDWQVVLTATGNELRLLRGLQASQQIVLDAILIPSLGGELATINIPDERWLLSGAAARCYDFLIQAAPGQQTSILEKRRQEMQLEFSRLSTRFQPVIDKPIRLNDVTTGQPRASGDGGGWW